MFKQCDSCGCELQPRSKFCDQCGTPLYHKPQVFESADLDSVLQDQFGRLYEKEKEVAHRIRQSKRTYKYLASYLSQRGDIELKYAKSIKDCINSVELSESELINATWNDIISKETEISEKHKLYSEQLKEQSSFMLKHYQQTKTDQYDIKKQIRQNESKKDKTQKTMDKVCKEIEHIEEQIKKIRDSQSSEKRQFTEKEVSKLKEFDAKLHGLNEKKAETDMEHFHSINEQNKEMLQNMKSFLKDQVDHLYRIQKLFMQMLIQQTEMRSQCNEVELLRLESVSKMNPVQDLLDFINSISDDKNVTPWIKVGSNDGTSDNEMDANAAIIEAIDKTDHLELQTGTRSSNSVDDKDGKKKKERVVSDLAAEIPSLTNSQLMIDFWECAFPELAVLSPNKAIGAKEVSIDLESKENDKNNESNFNESKTDSNNNNILNINDSLLNETALDDSVVNFQSLFSPNVMKLNESESLKKRAKNSNIAPRVPNLELTNESLGRQIDFEDFRSKRLQLEIDQLFPPDLPLQNLDSFDLSKKDWHRIFFETMFLCSNFFKSLNPHISYVWQIVIPNKLEIDSRELRTLTTANLPPVKNLKHPRYRRFTDLHYYIWLINYRSVVDFATEQAYYEWLHRQITVITAATAWLMYNCKNKYLANPKHEWKVADGHCVAYQEFIAFLNRQCSKLLAFAAHQPKKPPTQNENLQIFIANVECIFRQINIIRKDKIDDSSNLNEKDNQSDQTSSSEATTSANGLITPIGPSPDAYIPDYDIQMPQEFAHFLLWSLISRILIQKKKTTNKNGANKKKTQMTEIKEDATLTPNDNNAKGLNLKKKEKKKNNKKKSKKGSSKQKETEAKVERKDDEMVMIGDNYDAHDTTSDDSMAQLSDDDEKELNINHDNDEDDEDSETRYLHSTVLQPESSHSTLKFIRNDSSSNPQRKQSLRDLGGDWQAMITALEPFCNIFEIHKSTVWIFISRLVIDIIIDHCKTHNEGINVLNSVKTLPASLLNTIIAARKPNEFGFDGRQSIASDLFSLDQIQGMDYTQSTGFIIEEKKNNDARTTNSSNIMDSNPNVSASPPHSNVNIANNTLSPPAGAAFSPIVESPAPTSGEKKEKSGSSNKWTFWKPKRRSSKDDGSDKKQSKLSVKSASPRPQHVPSSPMLAKLHGTASPPPYNKSASISTTITPIKTETTPNGKQTTPIKSETNKQEATSSSSSISKKSGGFLGIGSLFRRKKSS